MRSWLRSQMNCYMTLTEDREEIWEEKMYMKECRLWEDKNKVIRSDSEDFVQVYCS